MTPMTEDEVISAALASKDFKLGLIVGLKVAAQTAIVGAEELDPKDPKYMVANHAVILLGEALSETADEIEKELSCATASPK